MSEHWAIMLRKEHLRPGVHQFNAELRDVTAWLEVNVPEPPTPASQLAGAVDLLATFVDGEPCSLDHHGYCQAHGWLQEGECNVARARRLIRAVVTTVPTT